MAAKKKGTPLFKDPKTAALAKAHPQTAHLPETVEELHALRANDDWMEELVREGQAEEQAEQAAAEVPVSNLDLIQAAEEFAQLKDEEARLDAELKQVKDRRMQLGKEVIPDLMQKLGMVNNKGKGSFTFSGGRIHLEQKLYASCSEAGRLELFPFLRESGDADLIKETVNAQTLSAYIRERRSEGLNDPPGVSVHEEVTAKLTKVK